MAEVAAIMAPARKACHIPVLPNRMHLRGHYSSRTRSVELVSCGYALRERDNPRELPRYHADDRAIVSWLTVLWPAGFLFLVDNWVYLHQLRTGRRCLDPALIPSFPHRSIQTQLEREGKRHLFQKWIFH